MLHKIAILVAATVVGSTVALAQLPLPLPLPGAQGTPEDRAACEPDVKRHCKNAIPLCPGITTSSNTKSGCSVASAPRAVSAESASAIRYFDSSARRNP